MAALTRGVPFDVLQSAVDEEFGESLVGEEDDSKKKKLRGAKLRELGRFLEENDAKKGWGGLQRVQKDDGELFGP